MMLKRRLFQKCNSMNEDLMSGDICKVSPDDWSDGKEVEPPEPEPKRCAACACIFVPKWHTAMRCDWCRKNKIPYMDDNNADKPF